MQRFIIIASALTALAWICWPATSVTAKTEAKASFAALAAVGEQVRFDFTYQAQQDTEVLRAAEDALGLEGSVDLAGVLRVDRARTDEMVLRIERLRTHEFEVAGQAVLQDQSSVETLVVAHRVWVPIRADGGFGTLRFAPDAPPFYTHLMRGLISELELAQQVGSSWTVDAANTRGAGPVTYRRLPGTVERWRSTYADQWVAPGAGALPVSAFARFSVVGEAIESVYSEETLRVTHDGARTTVDVRFEMTRAQTSVADAVARPIDAVAIALDSHEVSAEAQRRGREQRIAGMTLDQIINDTLQYAPGGVLPDHERWLWRAVGLLEHRPELCAKLVPVLADAKAGSAERALLLDLLASAGHGQAQAAMVAGLRSAATQSDPAHDVLLQRLGFVEAPTEATIRFLSENVEREDATRLAAAAALGSLVHVRGDEVGLAANAKLRAAVAGESEPRAQVALLKALGNAGQPVNLDLVGDLARAADPGVRAAAAIAVRKAPNGKARDLLHTLSADADEVVRNTALDTLFEVGPSLADRERVAQQVIAGTYDRGNLARLLPLLGNADSEAIRDALAFLPSLAPDDVRLKRNVAAML